MRCQHRDKLLFFSLLLVSIALAGAADSAAMPAADPPDSVIIVYPTGDPAQDVANVQWALDNVDSPGTVILKSTDMSGNPLAFNFGGAPPPPPPDPGTGGVIRLLRPDITLTGDGWDEVLDEPKTKIIGGGGPFVFSPTVGGMGSMQGRAMVFAVSAPGVTIRNLDVTTSNAYTGVYVVSTTAWPASCHPTVIEKNHISVLNFGVIAAFTAAFPVRIDQNVFMGNIGVEARWIGFTLQPIADYPFDKPVVPTDSFGNPVRYLFEVTRNKILKTPGSGSLSTLTVYGWGNYGSQNPDPEVACRRLRPNTSTPFTYQYVPAGNGPVVIAGNEITVDSPGATVWSILLGADAGGLNDGILWGNKMSGICSQPLMLGPYGHNNIIMDNDFSGVQAATQATIMAADTMIAGNIFGPASAPTPPGIPPPVLALVSVNLYPGYTPMPNPVENCLLARNNYRGAGMESGSILLASRAELQWPFSAGTRSGTEVKNNMIFETGGFPPGFNDIWSQLTIVDTMINPETGLPYVHDNRVVPPADKALDPGLIETLKDLNELRKRLRMRFLDN